MPPKFWVVVRNARNHQLHPPLVFRDVDSMNRFRAKVEARMSASELRSHQSASKILSLSFPSTYEAIVYIGSFEFEDRIRRNELFELHRSHREHNAAFEAPSSSDDDDIAGMPRRARSHPSSDGASPGSPAPVGAPASFDPGRSSQTT